MKITLLPTPGEKLRTAGLADQQPARPLSGFQMATPDSTLISAARQQDAVRHGNLSKAIYKILPPPLDIAKVGNLTIQDWTARLMLWTLYIPQAYLAIKYKQHPFEVISRNLLIWTSTLALILLERSPRYGFNRWVDPLMRPKLAAVPKRKGLLAGPRTAFAKWVNSHRIETNYLEFLKRAGVHYHSKNPAMDEAVKEGIWAHLKTNEVNTLKVYLSNVKKSIPKLNGVALKTARKEAHDLTRFLNRFSVLGSTTFTIANLMIALVVGVLMNKLLFKFFAPLDKKFVPKIDKSSLDKALANEAAEKKGGQHG